MAWVITALASGPSSLAKLVVCSSLSQKVVSSIPSLGKLFSASLAPKLVVYPNARVEIDPGMWFGLG